MSTELNLLPCPFCESENLSIDTNSVQPDDYHDAWVRCDDCDAEGRHAMTIEGWLSSKDEAKAEAVVAWNRRASPAAAVPESALPPLPNWLVECSDYPLFARSTIVKGMQAYARAAVEADRASQEKLLREKDGIIKAHQVVLAEREAEIAALRADRAQQGEPVGMPLDPEAERAAAMADTDKVPYMIVFDDADRDPEMVIGGTRARYRYKQISTRWNAHLFVKIDSNALDAGMPSAATKAAAPADAPDESAPYTAADFMRAAVDHIDAGRLPRAKRCINEALRLASPAPDTGIPTAGEVEKAGWISVEDARKPDVGQTVLLWVRTLTRGWIDDIQCEAEGAQVEMGEYRRGESAEMSYFDCFASPVSDNDWITHWMPLPAGPSEAKAGETQK